MTVRRILPQIVPPDWDSGKPEIGSGTTRVRYLQDVDDLVHRPLNNRQTASTSSTAVTCNGSAQSTGIGTIQQKPQLYGEFTVKARVTFSVNSAGPAYVYVYRTKGNIPANGAAPNAGDVVVGGDAFGGGPMVSGVNVAASFSFLDTGLAITQTYRYYLAVNGPNGNVITFTNASQLLVMERS